MVPLFLEVQPTRRETCINVISCASTANTNNFQTSFTEARHSGSESCVTTFYENTLTHGNNTDSIYERSTWRV